MPGSLPEAGGVEGRVLAPAPPGVSQLVGGRSPVLAAPGAEAEMSLVQAVHEESVKGGSQVAQW